MGCYAALAWANDLPLDATPHLAGYLGEVESGAAFGDSTGDAGVGTHGGSEDHVAILCSRPGELGQSAFRPVRHERQVPLPRDHVFVVAVSGVAAPKTGAAREAYNQVAARIEDRREQLVAEREEIVPAAGDAVPAGGPAPRRRRCRLERLARRSGSAAMLARLPATPPPLPR